MSAGLANLLLTVEATRRRPARSWIGLGLYVVLALAIILLEALS